MTPDDLGGYATLSDPQLHPDGIQVAFVVSRLDLEQDRYERRIWRWDGTTARQFTHGPVDTRPRWSSDGSPLRGQW
jgi:dipeptidyl aminopeptidase/acylaminoacyl peptidase